MKFAYFARLRGQVSTQKYIKDMLADARDWVKSSKLSRKDAPVLNVHEAHHQLIDPLKQPTGKQLKGALDAAGLSPEARKSMRKDIYRKLQRSDDVLPTNLNLEYGTAGLEGRKNQRLFGRDLKDDPYYWKGRQARKSMTTQHMAADNLFRLNELAGRTPQIFKSEDVDLIKKSIQGATSNQENSYLLRSYGKMLSR